VGRGETIVSDAQKLAIEFHKLIVERGYYYGLHDANSFEVFGEVSAAYANLLEDVFEQLLQDIDGTLPARIEEAAEKKYEDRRCVCSRCDACGALQ
jgi:hypothetical protein